MYTCNEIQTGVGFITRQFTYHKGVVTDEHRNYEEMKSGTITELVKQITLSDGRTLSYSYDKEERITKVVETRNVNSETVTSQTEYTYDAMGQLLEEKRDGNIINRMTYDSKGNIKSRNGVQYTYGDSIWKDKLTGWKGYTITYDSQGNPVNYRGAALAWEKGRQLKKYGSNSYTYNAGGIRTSKTVGGVTHTYRLDGNRILSETWGSNTLTPLYDCEDSVCGIIYNGAAYYFIKNLQGDVIGIKDSRNINVAEYIYDAWGVCTVVSDTTEEGIAGINPYRYRSYYYDEETKLYYLMSRYYDPEVGRFLNADDAEIVVLGNNTIASNMFVYCDNNPINYCDESGYFSMASVFEKIGRIINSISDKLKQYLVGLFKYDRKKKVISISVDLIAVTIDGVIAFIVPWLLKSVVSSLLKSMLSIKKIRNTFIEKLLKFFTGGNRLGNMVLLLICKIALGVAGIKGTVSTIFNGIFDAFTIFLINEKSKIIGRSLSLISAFSTVGGIIGFISDFLDGQWDGYLSIRVI